MKVQISKPLQIVNKTWGYEEIVVNTKDYCGKILWFKPNSKFSLHAHQFKEESFRILYGSFKLIYIDTDNASKHELILREGDIIHIPRMLPHQLICIQKRKFNELLGVDGGGAIIEFSTHSEDSDSFRYESGDSQTNTVNTEKSVSSIILGYEK